MASHIILILIGVDFGTVRAEFVFSFFFLEVCKFRNSNSELSPVFIFYFRQVFTETIQLVPQAMSKTTESSCQTLVILLLEEG